jgi:hypothetical protein
LHAWLVFVSLVCFVRLAECCRLGHCSQRVMDLPDRAIGVRPSRTDGSQESGGIKLGHASGVAIASANVDRAMETECAGGRRQASVFPTTADTVCRAAAHAERNATAAGRQAELLLTCGDSFDLTLQPPSPAAAVSGHPPIPPRHRSRSTPSTPSIARLRSLAMSAPLPPASSSSSLSDFRAREDHLRRLDAQLNEKKNEVVRRAEELVQQQALRLKRMEAMSPRASAAAAAAAAASGQPQYSGSSLASYDHHTFTSADHGFLDETTGYRGRVETTVGPRGDAAYATGGMTPAQAALARSRPGSGIGATPSATAAASSASRTGSAYGSNRPVSAATQDGRRRSSGIPSTTGGSRVASAAAARITPSSLGSTAGATVAAASRPQSRIRSAAAAVSTISRQPSYSDEQEQDGGEDNGTSYFGGGGASAADGDYNADDAATGDADGAGGEDAGLDGIPSSAMGSAATIRFQKAKLTALQTSVQTLTRELAEREKEMADLKMLVKNGNDSREKLLRAKEALDKTTAAQSKQLVDLETKLASHEGEASTLRREVHSSAKARKDLEIEMQKKDTRLNRLAQEMERVKEQAARSKSGGAGGGGGAGSEEQQKEVATLRLTNKKLLQQRGDLLAGFKKQQKLIEILKKQKLHMELAKMLQFTEEEFAKCLEMGEI